LFNIEKWFKLIETRFCDFYYLFIAFTLTHLVHVHADRGRVLLLRRSRHPLLRATRVVATMTCKSLSVTGDFDEM